MMQFPGTNREHVTLETTYMFNSSSCSHDFDFICAMKFVLVFYYLLFLFNYNIQQFNLMNMFNIQYLKYNSPKIGISQVTIFVYIFNLQTDNIHNNTSKVRHHDLNYCVFWCFPSLFYLLAFKYKFVFHLSINIIMWILQSELVNISIATY